jgi:hypothetical protein
MIWNREKRRQEQKKEDDKNNSKRFTKKKNGKDKGRVNENVGIRRKCRTGEKVEINAKDDSV